MVPILSPTFKFVLVKKAVWEITFCQEASANQPIQVKCTMAATDLNEAIVNLTLVRNGAGSAAGVPGGPERGWLPRMACGSAPTLTSSLFRVVSGCQGGWPVASWKRRASAASSQRAVELSSSQAACR
jgi:hypothetical protein